MDLSLLDNLLQDVVVWEPSYSRHYVHDIRRAQKLTDTRGLSFIMIDMPDACKILDASLSRKFISISDLPNSFGKRDLSNDAWFLGFLFRKLFGSDGTLYTHASPQHVSLLRQVLLAFKKVDMPCPDSNIRKEVIEFVRIESEMRRPTLAWNAEELDTKSTSFLDGYRGEPDLISHRDTIPRKLLAYMDEVSKVITSTFDYCDPSSLVPRHGPGAVSDLKGDKYSFKHWPSKLEALFPQSSFSCANESLWLEDQPKYSPNEPPARLIAVPKTLKGPRLIASEPTSHQFLQQGLMKMLRESIAKHLGNCISFNNQSKSQDFARFASIDGSFATIDLSSASDRLSCWTVERVFSRRRDWLEALHAVRTRSVLVDLVNIKDRLLLKKYANQGSAVTFSLQSLVYAIICLAALHYEVGERVSISSIRRLQKVIRVFGDDLIIPSACCTSAFQLLTHLGLKVNMGKTHVRGHFRESCGGDYFKGVDVSPLYFTNLECGDSYPRISSWVDVSNNAYKRGLWRTARFMLETTKQSRYIPISHWGMAIPSHYTFQKLTNITSKGRWNKSIQRCEIIGLTNEVKKIKGERVGSQGIYQYFVDRPSQETEWSSGYALGYRVRLRKRWVPSHS